MPLINDAGTYSTRDLKQLHGLDEYSTNFCKVHKYVNNDLLHGLLLVFVCVLTLLCLSALYVHNNVRYCKTRAFSEKEVLKSGL